MEEGQCEYIVVSSTSEDSQNTTKNLKLKNNNLDKVWATNGSVDKASVVLLLPEPTIIHTIEIINAGSTMIEIFVSEDEGENEETLLPSSSMMTFTEAKQKSNTNRLRFFGPDKLTKGVMEKEWKRIRLQCSTFESDSNSDSDSEPFGLARVRLFRSAPDSDYVHKAIEDNKLTLPSALPSQIVVAPAKGCFTRAKSFSGATNSKKDDTNNNNNNNNNNKNNNNTTTYSKATNSPKKPTKRKREIQNDDYDEEEGKENKNSSIYPRSLTSAVSVTPKKDTARAKSLVMTPFNKIMSDVIIVISGIANPERQEIRDQALEMGAQYLPDWIDSATHLICSFPNTPKFNMAQKAGGTIVSAGWISDCYTHKTRLPETEYLLAEPKKSDKAMKNTMGSMREWLSNLKMPKKDSNKEGKDRKSLPKSFTFVDNSKVKSPTQATQPTQPTQSYNDNDDDDVETVEDSASDTTEPLSETSHLSLLNRANTTNLAGKYSTLTKSDFGFPSYPAAKLKEQESVNTGSGYSTEDMGLTPQETAEMSASEDEVINKQGNKKQKIGVAVPKFVPSSTPKLPTKSASSFDFPLPNYFKNVSAVLHGNFDPAMQTLLFRYVNAYSGDIENKVSSKTSHIITNELWNKELKEIKDKFPNVCIVRPSWVFDSHNEQRLVEPAQHSVVPNM